MKRYTVETKNGYQNIVCDVFDYDDFYLRFILNHEVIAMFVPDHWLSVTYIGED
jgi:hypothetical protein